MATVGVDFFRVDRSGATRRLLLIAGLLVSAGMTLIGAHLIHRLDPSLGHVLSLVGGLMVVSGLILGFGAMAMLLFENVYLLIREDGLLCHENGKETTIAWSDLDLVKLDEQREGAPREDRGVEAQGAPRPLEVRSNGLTVRRGNSAKRDF